MNAKCFADVYQDEIKKISSYDEQTKIINARRHLWEVRNFLKRYCGYNDVSVDSGVAIISKLFIAADEEISRDEYNFYVAVTDMNISYQEFLNYMKNGKEPEFKKVAKEMLDKLTDVDGKNQVVMYGLYLASANRIISKYERDLVDFIYRSF